MPKIPFNVDAYTARLIGRENVSKLNGAVLELVKNTYDADATICFIYYNNHSDTLYIGDNGSGMSSNVILKNWMTIGLSSKKTKFISKGGRIQTGAKGIGRFALDRIADKCSMLTTSCEDCLLWSVDWRDFDKENTITDISADLNSVNISFLEFLDSVENLEVKKLISNNFSTHGTIFKLTLLRDSWNSLFLDEIKEDLKTLVPSQLSAVFNIYVFDNTTKLFDAQVLRNDDSFSYDYKINFRVDKNGNTEIKIWRDEFYFGSHLEYIINNAGFNESDISYFSGAPIIYNTTFSEIITKEKNKIKNTVGEFEGVLYFGKLSMNKKDKEKYFYKEFNDRLDYRGAFGGIKIYRDQFRVRPYGDFKTSDFDWLQLSSRKNKSPASPTHPTGAWRVNVDQILGTIHISRYNTTLPDQANREGIVETLEFNLLKEFIIKIILLFERDRQYVFRKLNLFYIKEHSNARAREEIDKKAKIEEKNQCQNMDHKKRNDNIYDETTMVRASIAKSVIDEKDEVIQILEDENRLLRALATTGIATNTYIHEFREQTHELNLKIRMAKLALESYHDQQDALKKLNEADKIKESFTSWFRLTIESVRRDKRTQKIINLGEHITNLCDNWNKLNEEKNIKVKVNMPKKPIKYKCFPYEIEVIINNLIINSIASFIKVTKNNKLIEIDIKENLNDVILYYSDNGNGLVSNYKKNPNMILEPMESSKMNNMGEMIGTGMGMWIIKKTVIVNDGSIDLSRNITEKSGFYCYITLPKSNKTQKVE